MYLITVVTSIVENQSTLFIRLFGIIQTLQQWSFFLCLQIAYLTWEWVKKYSASIIRFPASNSLTANLYQQWDIYSKTSANRLGNRKL